jgi:hypothetical protein
MILATSSDWLYVQSEQARFQSNAAQRCTQRFIPARKLDRQVLLFVLAEGG